MNVCRTRKSGFIGTQPLLAGVLFAFISLFGILLIPSERPRADMHIEPQSGTARREEAFTVSIVVTTEVPVNVFKGELYFDHTTLRVASIDYNTSIADLWAEKPWYENGDGTINFIGGTTRSGGFLGTGALMTITFIPITIGPSTLGIVEARILAHDGLGSDVPLKESIDALFTVDASIIEAETVAIPSPHPATITVMHESKNTDLNGDGENGITDLSIFMVGMVRSDPVLDFNNDGKVGLSDLSILMSVE